MRLATIAGLALCSCGMAGAQERAAGAHDGHLGDPQPAAGDPLSDIVVAFELSDRDGNAVTLEDFRGRYVLVGFGFTNCAHICPMMALNMGKALRDTDKPASGVFISVDTERDSVVATDDYASKFGEGMMGLGGTIERINAAANNFKVSYAVTKTQNNYTVQHTANVYLISPDGTLADVFTFSTPAETLVEAMR